MLLNCSRLLSMIRDKIAYPIISNQHKIAMNDTYEEAVTCLNSLQSNKAYIENAANKGILPHSTTFSTTIAETQKFLLRTGVTLNDLDKLSIIHVAGTKGKGSTCAFCDNILREYGYKTGFYSSPHLVAVRERIRLNGKPITQELFAGNFFRVYEQLMNAREHPYDMPAYFRFLTILAFNIFLQENIDVAIVEVGIGGEYDCTNVIRNTPVVGITSLGIDHTSLLGNTIDQIAWQKAGIMKKNSKAFTVPQLPNAMKILKERSLEKECTLELIPNFNEYLWENTPTIIGIKVQEINASLAIQLAHTWLKSNGHYTMLQNKLFVPQKTQKGLENCKWPGRTQILHKLNEKFFLDGAHTADSLEVCTKWFNSITTEDAHKVLIFNATGDRNSEGLLQILNNIDFNSVYFVPNIATNSIKSDQINYMIPNDIQLNRCESHKNIWLKIRRNQNQNVSTFSSVEEAINNLPLNVPSEILVTGSLHLVGAALALLDPDLNTF